MALKAVDGDCSILVTAIAEVFLCVDAGDLAVFTRLNMTVDAVSKTVLFSANTVIHRVIALMQDGREITLDAASTLLNHHWIGQSRLVQFFWSIWDELDDETQRLWVSRLRPPDSPFNEFPEDESRSRR